MRLDLRGRKRKVTPQTRFQGMDEILGFVEELLGIEAKTSIPSIRQMAIQNEIRELQRKAIREEKRS